MINNKAIANINTDKALASVLSNFDSNYITHIVSDSLEMKFRPYSNSLPGIYSIESTFNNLLNNIEEPDARENILDVREKTYLEIIDIVCNYYDIQFQPPEDVDLYSAVYWIYNFFVSDFTNTILNFYINYILKEKDGLYSYLNLDKNKKDKDSTTVYSKKVCSSDEKISIIHANIETVLDAVSSFDIGFQNLVLYSIGNNEQLTSFLISSIVDLNDVFKYHFASLLQTQYRADIITCIKLGLQQRLGGNIMTDPSSIIKAD